MKTLEMRRHDEMRVAFNTYGDFSYKDTDMYLASLHREYFHYRLLEFLLPCRFFML